MAKPASTRVNNGQIEKECTKCRGWFVADSLNFSGFKSGRLGLHPWCRNCLRTYERERQALLGKPVRKPRANLGSLPQVQRPAPELVERILESACIEVDDAARFRIYLITNTRDGKHYVGITEQPLRARWKQHLMSAHREGGYLLHEAMRADGIEAFCFQYIAAARNRHDLNLAEMQLVEQYNSCDAGYNQTRGGSAGPSVGTTVTVGGQEFISISAAGRHFGVSETTALQRLNRYGWTLDQAFGLVPGPKRKGRGKAITVGGESFASLLDACARFEVNESSIRSRLGIGWTLEQAFGLQPPPRRGRNAGNAVTVAGVTYPNIVQACEARKLDHCTVSARVRRGWSIAQAFNLEPAPKVAPAGKAIVVDGREFRSVAEACRELDMPKALIASRLQLGWAPDQAFGLALPPPPSGEKNGKPITVAGVTYTSLVKAAEAHGLDPRVVRKRINVFKWPVDQAFGLVPRTKQCGGEPKVFAADQLTQFSLGEDGKWTQQ